MPAVDFMAGQDRFCRGRRLSHLDFENLRRNSPASSAGLRRRDFLPFTPFCRSLGASTRSLGLDCAFPRPTSGYEPVVPTGSCSQFGDPHVSGFEKFSSSR